MKFIESLAGFTKS